MEDIKSIAGLLLFSLPGEGGGEAAYRFFSARSPHREGLPKRGGGNSRHAIPERFRLLPARALQRVYLRGLSIQRDGEEKTSSSPFGYGLSYSRFRYRNLAIETTDDCLEIGVDVKNIGPMAAKEVVQVYLSLRGSRLVRPQKELKGFEKSLSNRKKKKQFE